MSLARSAYVLSFAPFAFGQYGPGRRFGPGGYDGADYNPFNGGGRNSFNSGSFGASSFFGRNSTLIAHGVLASLAFVVFFPIGSIMIRLASFPGLWLVHGLFQIFAFLLYMAAFALGVWMTQKAPAQANLIGRYHPVIGIVVFALLFLQPILGFIHHVRFKKKGYRTIWSYGHLWLGRGLITLGMINGGLGLWLAMQTGYARPSAGQIVAYGVVAGVMWALWVAASIVGERRRARVRKVRRWDI